MDYEQIKNLNIFLGYGAIALQIASVAVLVLLLLRLKDNFILNFIHKHYVLLSFLMAFSASAFSLVYSEIVGWVPCYLCWYARVFMLPLVFLFGGALYYKDRLISRYAWLLLIPAMLLALYHNFRYYLVDNADKPCDASGISCYQQLVHEFGGYISIPMLSLTSIVAIAVILLVVKFYKNKAIIN